jgi:hypothetical protein
MPTAETIVVRSSYVANNDSALQLAPAMFVSQLRKSDPLLPKNNFLSQGWLIRRLFEVWMHFTLLDLRGRLHPLSYPCTIEAS